MLQPSSIAQEFIKKAEDFNMRIEEAVKNKDEAQLDKLMDEAMEGLDRSTDLLKSLVMDIGDRQGFPAYRIKPS